MYLFQRLIGVGTYAFTLISICLLIPRVKGFRIHLNIYILILALMGFFYVPATGSDLSRIYPLLNLYGQLDLASVWNEVIYGNSGSPMSIIYYHLVGSLGDKRLLPFINTILTYSFCFTILKNIYFKINVSKNDIVLVLFFFMARGLFMMTIANIRTMLSLSIIAYCIYQQLVGNKNIIRYIPLLAIAALLHTVGIAAILIYLFYYILEGNKNRKRIFTFIEAITLIFLFYKLGNIYIQKALDKGIDYVAYSQSSIGYFYIWEMVLSVCVLTTILVVILIFYRDKKSKSTKFIKENFSYYSFINFIFFFSCFSLVAIFIEFNIGLRLSWLASILSMPLFSILLTDMTLSYNTKRNIRRILFLVGIVMLLLACTRGDLCSLKFS